MVAGELHATLVGRSEIKAREDCGETSLAGLRADAPSEAHGADGGRARRRPKHRCTASKNTGDTASKNPGGAAARTPVAQPQEHRCTASKNPGSTTSPEASRRLRASTQGSLVVDEVQPRAALAHEDAEVAVLVRNRGV